MTSIRQGGIRSASSSNLTERYPKQITLRGSSSTASTMVAKNDPEEGTDM